MPEPLANIAAAVKRRLGRRSHYLLEGYYALRHRLWYRGDRRYCPCCGTSSRTFLPGAAGLAGRPAEVRCPRCDAHPRHRLLWLYLRQYRPELFTRSLRLLHVAPEFCFYRKFLRLPTLTYITADLAAPLADCRLDITRLPFPERAFDVIFCNHVLEHVANDRLALTELYRVLRPEGWAVLQAPVDLSRPCTFEDAGICSPAERARHFGQHDHLRLYGADYPQRLAQGGFQVSVTAAAEFCDARTIERCCLDPGEPVYLVTRPAVAP